MDVTLVPANPPLNVPVNGAAVTTSAPATGNPILKNSLYATFQVISAAAATVIFEVTNDPLTAVGTNSNWIPLATVTLAAAGTDGFATSSAWRWVRARVTAASAATRVYMGC